MKTDQTIKTLAFYTLGVLTITATGFLLGIAYVARFAA
tara:strand:+ start:2099 stop:2212 length:114 start_codon:yes stop_codon:yes gene_type:complete